MYAGMLKVDECGEVFFGLGKVKDVYVIISFEELVELWPWCFTAL